MTLKVSALSASSAALVVLSLGSSAAAQPAEPAPPPPPAEAQPPAEGPPAAEGAEGDQPEGDDDDNSAAEGAAPETGEAKPAEPKGPDAKVAAEGKTETGEPPTELPPVPMAPPALFPSQLEELDEGGPPNVGFSGGRLYIRSDDDSFRLYPGGRMRTDFNVAPGAPDLPPGVGDAFTNPAFHVRRVRLELSGEIIQRLAFTMGMELGGGRIGEVEYTGPDTPRWARATAHDGRITPADVSVSYRFRDWLSLTAGNFNSPFSMSNRTREHGTTFLERPMAIRSFAVPYNKDLGLAVWGELDERMFAYEVGVFSGDGPDHPFVDARPDVTGRVFVRPLVGLGSNVLFKKAQIGVSARHGERDQEHVAYDYPSMATGQGFIMWQPGYVDSFDRVTHVIPSGAQNAIGGELRLPFSPPTGAVFDVRGEAYYLANNTREAVDGFELTNTERFGRMKGVSWYAMVSFWGCCTDQLVSAEPGITRPVTVELGEDVPVKRGINVAAMGGGIHANYSGATRVESQPDANTPSSDITIYQVGGIVQYWYSWNFRAALEYMAYIAPKSGDATQNQAVVPHNLIGENKHVHHELGLRLAVTF